MMVGRLLSYWEGNFSGGMLNFGRVFMCKCPNFSSKKNPLPRQPGQETPASESLTLALAQGGLAKAAERILFRLEVDAGELPVDGGKSG